MKDDSGSYAVFTEQGSSASQMTAAKVMAQVDRRSVAQSAPLPPGWSSVVPVLAALLCFVFSAWLLHGRW